MSQEPQEPAGAYHWAHADGTRPSAAAGDDFVRFGSWSGARSLRTAVHLLKLHEPGNELRIVAELAVPGGSIDYCLASIRDGKPRDFVGIELQTLDTTGTVWPERQRFLREHQIRVNRADAASDKPFGMNWKMTTKTILVQAEP